MITSKLAIHHALVTTSLTRARADTTPKANKTTMMVTVEADPMGTAKTEIKGEASAMTLRPRTREKATMEAGITRPRVETQVLARTHH
jgi:hypothetical protein